MPYYQTTESSNMLDNILPTRLYITEISKDQIKLGHRFMKNTYSDVIIVLDT